MHKGIPPTHVLKPTTRTAFWGPLGRKSNYGSFIVPFAGESVHLLQTVSASSHPPQKAILRLLQIVRTV